MDCNLRSTPSRGVRTDAFQRQRHSPSPRQEHSTGSRCGAARGIAACSINSSLRTAKAYTESVLYWFGDLADAGTPNGPVVLDSKGAIYGVRVGGGRNRPCSSSPTKRAAATPPVSPPATARPGPSTAPQSIAASKAATCTAAPSGRSRTRRLAVRIRSTSRCRTA